MGFLASLTLEDKVRQDLDLPQIVCEYEGVFPDELSELPPPRDVDFRIELHPSTSPISMTPRVAGAQGPDIGVTGQGFH